MIEAKDLILEEEAIFLPPFYYAEVGVANKLKRLQEDTSGTLFDGTLNIEEIVKLGRARWKIENEGFREQKNGTFKISHLCSRNENAIKIHYYLIQIDHIIRQLLDKGSKVLRDMKLKTKKEVSKFIIKCFTSKTTTSDLNHDIPNFQLRFNDD